MIDVTIDIRSFDEGGISSVSDVPKTNTIEIQNTPFFEQEIKQQPIVNEVKDWLKGTVTDSFLSDANSMLELLGDKSQELQDTINGAITRVQDITLEKAIDTPILGEQ